jgi:hypothetical protein
VRLPSLIKGAVLAHRFERPLAAELDESEQRLNRRESADALLPFARSASPGRSPLIVADQVLCLCMASDRRAVPARLPVVQDGRAGLDRRRARLRLNAGAVGVRLDALCGISVARPTSSPSVPLAVVVAARSEVASPVVPEHPAANFAADAPARDRSASNGANPPVEHVRTHCPAAIATLVAIARTAEDDQGSTANLRRIAASADRHEGR